MHEITVSRKKIQTEPAVNPPSGYIDEWVEVTGGEVLLCTKQSDGTKGTAGGGGAIQTIAAKTADYQIVEADNNKLITNYGTTGDIELTLPERSTLPAGWKVKAVNEAAEADGGIDSYTKLMLHMNGANDGTTFADSSASDHTVTANGDAVTKTGTKKFGTASGYFDGTGDSLSIPYSSDFDFGSGDFTVDAWVYPDSGSDDVDRALVFGGGCASPTAGWAIYIYGNGGDGGLELAADTGSGWAGGRVVSSSKTPTGQWSHVSVVRNGSNLYTFINGVLTGSNTISGSINSNGLASGVGADRVSSGSYFKGYIEELRISKGLARWTSNFTPPSSEYFSARAITLTPYSGDQLPTTAAADNQLISSTKGDVIELENTGNSWIANTLRPEASWVDGL